MASGLAQAAVLVEIALREFERAVVVSVADRGVWMEHLHPAGLEHRAPERLVLGVLHVRKAHLGPALARIARVHVREEREIARSLEARPPVRREPGEELR